MTEDTNVPPAAIQGAPSVVGSFDSWIQTGFHFATSDAHGDMQPMVTILAFSVNEETENSYLVLPFGSQEAGSALSVKVVSFVDGYVYDSTEIRSYLTVYALDSTGSALFQLMSEEGNSDYSVAFAPP